jgi:hypothetical protein
MMPMSMVISFLLRTCAYNEPGFPRQASETTEHSKPFRVFLTIPRHAEHGMRGGMPSPRSCRVIPGTPLLINAVDGLLFTLLGMIQTCDASSFPDNL